MKFFLFCICISYSLGADNSTKPQRTSEKGSPNEHNRTNEPADRPFSIPLRNEGSPSDSSEPEQSLIHDANFPITSGVMPGLDTQRGDGQSRDYETQDSHSGAQGADRLETWNIVRSNSSSGQHSLGIPSGGLSAVTESYNVENISKVESNENIVSAMDCTAVRPKNPRRFVESCGPSSDDVGTNLPSFAGTFGNNSRLNLTCKPLIPSLPPISEFDGTTQEVLPPVIDLTTPMDINVEQSSNSADQNRVVASRSAKNDQASSSTSEQNYVTNAETHHTSGTASRYDLPMFNYTRTLYTLKQSLSDLVNHFGTPENMAESLTLERSRKSVDLLTKIQQLLKEMASMSSERDFARFQIDSQSLNLVLSTITELTTNIDVYLVGIHHNREEAVQRTSYLMHIIKKLQAQMAIFITLATPELLCLKDKSHLDVWKKS